MNKPVGGGDGWWAYKCGHCGDQTTGAVLAYTVIGSTTLRWVQCSSCREPSVSDSQGRVYPGNPFGDRLEGLPLDVEAAYEEARRCLSINADIAAELICRKILMHVAVEKEAKEGESFEDYIKHLVAKGYVTPPMKPWVDLIRKHGNDATHKLDPRDRKRAEATLLFTTHLLRNVYEMEHLAEEYLPKPAPAKTP